MSSVPLYDAFSVDYDRFVDWSARLAFEMPFFRALFQEHSVQRVLDVAAGTGQHAIAFAREGYEVSATDLSAPMVARAQANAAAAGVTVRLWRAGFADLAAHEGAAFDALTCLGNSLPHLTDEEALRGALRGFAQMLRPGGILVIQNRNFDRVLAQQERFMAPTVHREGEQEWVFLRFYDFLGPLLRFNVVRMHRQGDAPWAAQLDQTMLRGWARHELERLLGEEGLTVQRTLGSYRGEPFEANGSGDLILIAQHCA
jgi:SAM-dependent methyltransferase